MIQFTQGDTAVLNLTAEDGEGNAVDITGATFTTLVRGPGGVTASFPNSQHAIVDAENGQFTLTLSANDTTACGAGSGKDVLTQLVQGGSSIYYRGIGILTVYPPVPVQ